MYHNPVMLQESLEGLNIQPGGIYLDVTFGGGGHSSAILSRLKEGTLYAFDQDEEAEAQNSGHPNLVFTRANFRFAEHYMKLYQAGRAQGILADLGISSHQIDEPARGFSTRGEGPLDMRMDVRQGLTAADVVNNYSEAELHRILGMYGELKNARTLASAIVKARVRQSIRTTEELKKVLAPFAPKGKEFKYQAQVFQALRIEVNQELKALEELLEQSSRILAPGGRLVVMSYHSLEDRMVKHFIQTGNLEGKPEKDLYGNLLRPFEPFIRKPLEASAAEVAQNPRARSARLRIGVRTEYNKPKPDGNPKGRNGWN
jgi:16S rRNA (cytosine1402-N4)-methyltransferase